MQSLAAALPPRALPDLAGEELETALTGLDLDLLPVMYGGRMPNDQAPTDLVRRAPAPGKVRPTAQRGPVRCASRSLTACTRLPAGSWRLAVAGSVAAQVR